MARFDVFQLVTGDLALDCQSDLLAHLSTRFTVPLIEASLLRGTVAGLNPAFDIDGSTLVMATHLAGTIPTKSLKTFVASLAAHDYEIQRALDTLAGFY